MHPVAFLIPGDLESRTGGYGYDRRIIEGLRAIGWSVDVHQLDVSYPEPTADARHRAAQTLAQLDDDRLAIVDGLAFGAMADEAEHERDRLRLIALVHHPLANETGISLDAARRLEASERRALACARLVVVTSRSTVRSLGPYAVPAERIAVVEPGTDPGPLAIGSDSSTCQLLCVASVTPRKGYETLMHALSDLSDLDWQLTCVGSLERAPDTVRRVRSLVARARLDDRVRFLGELDEAAVAACYHAADLFVLPTFHEGYGMVVAEALARGLPVIATPTGAVPDLVGEHAGILVPVGDAAALADALRRAITDSAFRSRVAEGARLRRDHMPSWRDAAAAMSAALSRLL